MGDVDEYVCHLEKVVQDKTETLEVTDVPTSKVYGET